MQIIITENYEELSKKAAEVILEVMKDHDKPVLGLATGSSPIGLYNNLIADHTQNHTSYKDVITFNLDEYVGLKRNHSQTYYTFMHENLFHGLDINDKNIHLPIGDSDNLEKECIDYEKKMEDYQIDIQLLGIGSNGHIGFNEPGTSFDTLTHIVELKESTRKDNARFFEPLNEEVPTHAITMGIKTIMKAKKILVIASGANKADAVYNMVKGAVSTYCPASVLQNHSDVVLILDKAASTRL